MSCSIKDIRTDRLVIRRHEIEDVQVINSAQKRSFKSLHPWMEWANEIPSIEKTLEFIQFSMKMWEEEKPKNLPFLVFKKGSNEFVGGVAYVSINWEVASFEIGYWRDIKHPHKGYISEATNALAQFAFRNFKANRVQVCCDADNLPSKKVPERLNFLFEARLKNHRVKPVTKNISDTLVYAVFNIDQLPPLEISWE